VLHALVAEKEARKRQQMDHMNLTVCSGSSAVFERYQRAASCGIEVEFQAVLAPVIYEAQTKVNCRSAHVLYALLEQWHSREADTRAIPNEIDRPPCDKFPGVVAVEPDPDVDFALALRGPCQLKIEAQWRNVVNLQERVVVGAHWGFHTARTPPGKLMSLGMQDWQKWALDRNGNQE